MGNEQVMDERTRELIFPKSRGFRIPMDDDLEERIAKYVQTPIPDLDEINTRLDITQELVENPSLIERLVAIGKLFSLPKQLYEQVKKADRMSEFGFSYELERESKILQNLLYGCIDFLDKSPDIKETDIKSGRLKPLVQLYSNVMSGNSESGFTKYADYVKSLGVRVKELENDPTTKEIHGEKIIDLKQLLSLIDLDYLKKSIHLIPSSAKDIFGNVNVYLSLAKEAAEEKYTRPVVVPKDENCLIIKNGKYDVRHNLWDKAEIVPNDTDLTKANPVEVDEGVNDGGKTFDMKKAVYIAARALAGCFVPAEYAKVSIRDKIIMREKGVGDAISAFQQDCRSIREATPQKEEYWLIGMDEAFTSTERKGGEALVYGYIKAISENTNSLLILSSHYARLSNAFKNSPRVRFCHFPFITETSEDKESKVQISFPHTKKNNPMDNYSYAVSVAKAAGFDGQIITYAEERLRTRGFD